MSFENVKMVGPFCAECGKDTRGEPASYVPAPRQGGPFYYCSGCRPPVFWESLHEVSNEWYEAVTGATSSAPRAPLQRRRSR